MNTIDIHEGLARNLDYEAKSQAKLDDIYNRSRKNYIPCNNQSYNNDKAILSMIESRLSCIENKIDKLYEMMVTMKESNGLFVFAPEGNVNSAVSFQLSDIQFKEMMTNIMK